MGTYLNETLGFDEVRWATMCKTNCDSRVTESLAAQAAQARRFRPQELKIRLQKGIKKWDWGVH